MGLLTNDLSCLSLEFRYGIPGIVRTRNRSGIGRNSRNWKEFLGIPTNSGITTYMGLFANDRSWLSIEFRYGIPGIVTTRNRSGIGRNSWNWKEFPELEGIPGIGRNSHRFPGIPESQLTSAYLRMIGPGYRSNSATEFPELEGPGIDQESDGIPGVGGNSHRFPGIPESQLTSAYLPMIGPGYRSNSATEFPEL